MAKVIKLKDRQGSVVLPLTRSQLVQVSSITGIDLLNNKSWSSASVQDALEAIASYVQTQNGGYDTELALVKSYLQTLIDLNKTVKNYVDEQNNAYLDLAYAQSTADAKAAQDAAYAEAAAKATEAQTNAYTEAAAKATEAQTNAYAYTRAEVDAEHAAAYAEAAAQADAAETAAKQYADKTFLNTVKLNSSYLTVQTDETNGRFVDLGSIATSEGLQGLTQKVEAIEAAYATSEALGNLKTAYENGYTALQTRIAANESAITTLNGSAQTQGSVAYQVAEGIAGVVAGADADFDTLKEVADWIKSDTTGAAAMQTAISTLNGDDTVNGSVAKQVKDSYTAMESHTVNGKALSTNPVLDATDIAYSQTQTVEQAIADLYSQVGEGGSVSTQIEDAINDLDASYTATGTAAHSGTYVISAIAQTDGVLSSATYTEVEAAGAAAAVKTALTGDATTYTNLGLAEDAIEALQTSYSNLNTELTNAGVFYEEVSSITVDDLTLA